ncbi:MAG: type II toxin-antitoxin system HicB family antitoxin [Deltaproteobacteria bacterium]|nr:type II toxin-antitoxin system HicB family antitoxin [Deltaproteobacteria bacterium]
MATEMNTVRKIGISVPRDLLRAVDSAAQRRGESRSGFVVRVLAAATARARDREITRRLDELFADADLQAEQIRTAEAFLGAQSGDAWEP